MNKDPGENIRKKAEDIALFRYGIISPILYQREEKQNEYFRDLASKEYQVPHLGTKKYSVSTFKSWLYAYRREGFDGLIPRARKDKGSSRKIPLHFGETLKNLVGSQPYITYSTLYRELISGDVIKPYDFTLQTLIKFMKDRHILLREHPVIPRKKFETEHVNDLWIMDFMESISLFNGRRKGRTYLLAIIDDYSRMIVGYLWSFHDNAAVCEEVVKSAMLTHGLPRKLYADNAKVFSSQALHLPCAKLGIAFIHSKPYDAASRGKVERWFKTVQTMFLPTIKKENLTISALNASFDEWVKNEYHRRVHQGIGEPPLMRFMRGLEQAPIRRIPEEALELIFYRKIRRRVKKDCTVSVSGKLYEAPAQYIGMEVELRFSSSTPTELFIFEQEQPSCKLKILDIHQNANPPHVSINFSNLLKKEAV